MEPGQRGGRRRREQTQSEFLAAPGDMIPLGDNRG